MLFIDRETLQIVLDLINPLHGSLDVQVTEQFTDERELDPPKDREYSVDITWQMERDLTQAVCILERRLRDEEWQCLGQKRGLVCSWPDCGCDHYATKVIETLVKQGWIAPAQAAAWTDE